MCFDSVNHEFGEVLVCLEPSRSGDDKMYAEKG